MVVVVDRDRAFVLSAGPQKALLLAIALGAAVALPLLDLLLLLIPNAAVLLFPSWIQTGKDSPRGIEATGQRLVFALGQLLVLALALLPAAAAFAGVFFLLNFTVRPGCRHPAGLARRRGCRGGGGRFRRDVARQTV